jgi:hypothetical protein
VDIGVVTGKALVLSGFLDAIDTVSINQLRYKDATDLGGIQAQTCSFLRVQQLTSSTR